MDFSDKTVLILAPHPDDEVFGCGGFIHRLKQDSARVYVLFITNGTTEHFVATGKSAEFSTAPQRRNEIEQVADFLNYDGYSIAFEGDQYHLQLDQLPQRELVHAIERGGDISLESLQPDIVLTPMASDYNQDHRATFLAAMTALRPASTKYRHFCPLVMCYELPYQQWNVEEQTSAPEYLVRLSTENMSAKIAALELYSSQLKSLSSPLSVHGIKTLASLRGLQCGVEAAEAYTIRRLVV